MSKLTLRADVLMPLLKFQRRLNFRETDTDSKLLSLLVGGKARVEEEIKNLSLKVEPPTKALPTTPGKK